MKLLYTQSVAVLCGGVCMYAVHQWSPLHLTLLMWYSSFHCQSVIAEMAVGYLINGEVAPLADLGWNRPCGQMYSTVEDLNKVSGYVFLIIKQCFIWSHLTFPLYPVGHVLLWGLQSIFFSEVWFALFICIVSSAEEGNGLTWWDGLYWHSWYSILYCNICMSSEMRTRWQSR